MDFIAAWAASLEEPLRDYVGARSLIVENRDAWRNHANSKHPLILIPDFRFFKPDSELLTLAQNKGHYLIIPQAKSLPSTK